jgi:hypothetical protein
MPLRNLSKEGWSAVNRHDRRVTLTSVVSQQSVPCLQRRGCCSKLRWSLALFECDVVDVWIDVMLLPVSLLIHLIGCRNAVWAHRVGICSTLCSSADS